MKKITCKKPCTIGGQRFAIGESVPLEAVDPTRETALVKYGFISIESSVDKDDKGTDPPYPKRKAEKQVKK